MKRRKDEREGKGEKEGVPDAACTMSRSERVWMSRVGVDVVVKILEGSEGRVDSVVRKRTVQRVMKRLFVSVR